MGTRPAATFGRRDSTILERKRIEKLRYMHRNPVKRGLVASPEQWRWSSFRAYRYGETGRVRINDTTVLQMQIHGVAGG